MTRREIIAEGIELYLGDCREILPEICWPALYVTSPPYDRQRDYVTKISDWRSTVAGLAGILGANGTQIFVNLGLIYRNGEVHQYWDGLIADMRANGWRLFGWYVWDQGAGLAGNWKGRPAPAHEWIFHFNRDSIEPNKTVPCLHAGLVKKRGPKSDLRNADGQNAAWSSGVSESTVQPFKIPDSVFRIGRQRYSGGAIESQHPAVFPVELPTSIIEAYSVKDDWVCDPFMGSGTTGIAALRLGRRFIGIEIEPKYFDIACKRIANEVRLGQWLQEPPPPHSPAGTADQ